MIKVIAFIVLVSVLFLIYVLRRNPVKKIPVLHIGGNIQSDPLEYYRLETPYATTQTGRDLLISDYHLYIIRGSSDVGNKLHLYHGDCILVDDKIKEVSDTYKAYLVEEFPEFSARKGTIILPKSEIKQDNRIIGAIVSKIPSEYMQKYRKQI